MVTAMIQCKPKKGNNNNKNTWTSEFTKARSGVVREVVGGVTYGSLKLS